MFRRTSAALPDASVATLIMELRKRALRAALWTVGAYGLDLGTRLLSTLVMTRLLFPAAFGVVAAATAIIVGLGLISDFGVRAVIIQSPRGEQADFLRSAWVFQGSRGILLWLVLVVICIAISLPPVQLSLPADSVFADHNFPLITSALGISLILAGFESTALGLNARQLHLKPLVMVDLTGKLFTIPIMFAWAWFSPSAWALVAGSLASSVIRLVMSHVIVPGPRMAVRWKSEHFREILHFGKWITVSSLASFITSQSDVIVLGLLLPSSSLGIYFIAKMLVGTIEGLLERLQSSLSLPIFGEVLRTDPRNLRNRYYRFRLPLDLAAGLFSGFIFVAGGLIINLLYDARYTDAGPMLQTLAIGLAFYPLQFIRSAFTAVGNTHLVASVAIVEAVSLITFMVAGFMAFGVTGAIIGIAGHRLVPSLVFWILSRQKNWFSFRLEIRIAAMFVLGLLAGKLFLLFSAWIDLPTLRHLLSKSH
jgi:O-antigen/teichoic acid export membrane protein